MTLDKTKKLNFASQASIQLCFHGFGKKVSKICIIQEKKLCDGKPTSVIQLMLSLIFKGIYHKNIIYVLE